jgi:hypothetical protein
MIAGGNDRLASDLAGEIGDGNGPIRILGEIPAY